MTRKRTLLIGGFLSICTTLGIFSPSPAFAGEERRPLLEILDEVAKGESPAVPSSRSEPPPSAPSPEPTTAPVEGQAPVVAVVPTPSPKPASKLGEEITLAEVRYEPPNSLPQQQAGEKWQPVRVHTEVRSRPRDTTIDAKAEVVTPNGWIFGVQHVSFSGHFYGSNVTDVWNGQYTDTRSEIWAGRHGATKDGLTRWSVNGFVRQLTHEDSGKGQSRPGAEYPDSYTWSNAPKPLTQVGVRARGERDIIRTESQQLTVHVEGEVATTVSGQSGWAYDVQAGVWYRTAQVEAYAEAGVNNTGAYANGYGRYYPTKGQLKPFLQVQGEVGSGYHNTQVGGGLQVGIGRNAYTEGVVGYNAGTSGNGLAATARLGFRF